MVSVLIPTVAREAMLRQALQSVAEQTAVRQINRIIVSENGGNRASERVCAEFPQLPISYFYREPALIPLEHARLLMKDHLQGEITCILHDDDWWRPHHLEQALSALKMHPEASVYGADYQIADEDVPVESYHHLLAWVGAQYPPVGSLWQMSRSNLLLASLLGLVVHFSTMVIRTEALRKSAYIWDLTNTFDTDRMLLYALTQHGPLVYSPTLSAVVRIHAKRDTSRFDEEERSRQMSHTTAWMVEQSHKSWESWASAFVKRISECPNEKIRADLISMAAVREWCLPEMARHLDPVQNPDFFSVYHHARQLFAGDSSMES